jgi:MFS family permease
MATLEIPAEATSGAGGDEELDPRRWITLAIVLISTLIVVLDNSVLNVAIPTILRDFHTTLPSLEWVITGYALTFATLLIIGGRLCDMYGTRRIFIIGAALFAVGSGLASASWNVGSLVAGEAVIEGIGASLMLPSALAVLSSTFHGQERGMAFAAWGAVAGSAAGLGPVVGGFLTTDFSWRWSFRINVIIAPLAILGALLVMAKSEGSRHREPLDVPGALLVASGMFLVVFGLSEGGTYGWIWPIADLRLVGWSAWPSSWPVSAVPASMLVGFGILAVFYRYERRREERAMSPLFEFSLLRFATFRYGLLTSMVLSMAALGFSLAMALYLQEALQLSALDNGLWMLPYGLMILAASPVGGKMTRRIGTISVVRWGLLAQAAGLTYLAVTVNTHEKFLQLLPGLIVYGLGTGFSLSQLTNVVLSQIPGPKSGVGSGTNSTLRQVGNALGIAVIGTLVTTQTVDSAVPRIKTSAGLGPGAKLEALSGLHALGANYIPSPGPGSGVVARILADSVTHAIHAALFYALGVVLVGAAASFLVPKVSMPEPSIAEDLAGLVALDSEADQGGPWADVDWSS